MCSCGQEKAIFCFTFLKETVFIFMSQAELNPLCLSLWLIIWTLQRSLKQRKTEPKPVAQLSVAGRNMRKNWKAIKYTSKEIQSFAHEFSDSHYPGGAIIEHRTMYRLKKQWRFLGSSSVPAYIVWGNNNNNNNKSNTEKKKKKVHKLHVRSRWHISYCATFHTATVMWKSQHPLF